MDHEEAARRWAATWTAAWRTHEVEPVVALYAEDCVHRSTPFRPPHRGRQAVRDYVTQAFADEQRIDDVRFGVPVVQGDRACVEYWARFLDQHGTAMTLAGCAMARFDADGHITEARDYWHLQEGHQQPPQEWAESSRLLQDSEAEVGRTRATPAPTSFVRAIPALAVSDVARAVAFFADVLGFDSVLAQGGYGIARRDAVEVHFWAATGPEGSGAEPRLAGTTSCRLQVNGLAALYERCQARQVVHPGGGLSEQPWGTREFTILDPDRNAVTFFEGT